MKTTVTIPKTPGVYIIINTTNNHFYIGSSNCLYKRFYAHHAYSKKKTQKAFKKMAILQKAYIKYEADDFTFYVLKETVDYREWEQLYINLLKPDYNSCTLINGNNRPNIGKKFSKEWSAKLGKCIQHTDETKKRLTKINKECSSEIAITIDNATHNFKGYDEMADHFNISRAAAISRVDKGYKNWKIIKQNNQRRIVNLKDRLGNVINTFKTAGECDRHLNLWNGATSNAVRNYQGQLHDYIVEYV